MLKGIHPLLTPELLHALAAMGHGDELVVADANFPAQRICPRVIEQSGVDSPTMLEAILTVFPLDASIPEPAVTMQVIGDPHAIPPAVVGLHESLRAAGCTDQHWTSLERHKFYERAARAAVAIRTGELRPYGNLILVKGVVNHYP